MSSISGPNADRRFVDYYSQQSLSDATLERFDVIKRTTLALRRRSGLSSTGLCMADIGCGPGAQSSLWAAEGHRVFGIDISAPLIDLARERAAAAGLAIEYAVGTAEKLPLPDASCDVVLLPELLEHVLNWQPCLDEAVRVLRPGGILYLCTTNKLCPRQSEFTLPLYSWYPGWLKRICVRKSVTSHPQWVQFTTFPAVNWFSFYQLRDHLARRGVDGQDRFDVMNPDGSTARATVRSLVRALPPLRLLAQIFTPYTVVFGVKRPVPTSS